MNRNTFAAVLIALVALAAPLAAEAQSSVAEDFTKGSTTNSWYFFNGACLTAGSAAGVEPSGAGTGQVPGCTTIASSYYSKTSGEVLVGGYNGTFPDPPVAAVRPATVLCASPTAIPTVTTRAAASCRPRPSPPARACPSPSRP